MLLVMVFLYCFEVIQLDILFYAFSFPIELSKTGPVLLSGSRLCV